MLQNNSNQHLKHNISKWRINIVYCFIIFALFQSNVYSDNLPNLENMSLSELQNYYTEICDKIVELDSDIDQAQRMSTYYYNLAQRYKNDGSATGRFNYNLYMNMSLKYDKEEIDYRKEKTNYLYEKTRVQNEIDRRKNLVSYTISVNMDPSSSGTITGGGKYTSGENCTLTATAKSGYVFR